MAKNIVLGTRGKDIITGFEGMVLAHAEYFTGCNQTLLTPASLDKDGKRLDAQWFDDSRIVITDSVPFVLPADEVAAKPGRDEPLPHT